ncbi:MAG TPA: hypothetical protein VM008_13455 [Phycisphaerae bacterium]|nr:hypothetical protein [Phycisphaerae bacterium]
MTKSLTLALLLILTSAAVATVTTAPDRLWDAQQQLKDAQAQITTLQGQIAQLQNQITSLQSENQSLKSKVSDLEDQLKAAATQPVKLTPEAINPPDLIKDYPAEKMPVYGDPSNPLRIHALNDWLTSKYAGKPVIITGKFQSVSGSTNHGFSMLVVTPDPSGNPRWTLTATLPTSATDDALHLKRDDPVTLSGTISRITYTTNAKFNTLAIYLKEASLSK